MTWRPPSVHVKWTNAGTLGGDTMTQNIMIDIWVILTGAPFALSSQKVHNIDCIDNHIVQVSPPPCRAASAYPVSCLSSLLPSDSSYSGAFFSTRTIHRRTRVATIVTA